MSLPRKLLRSFNGALNSALLATTGLVGCAHVTAPANFPACGNVVNFPGATWPAAEPAAAGWDLTRLEESHQLWESLDSAAVMVVHRGHLVASWGDVAERYTAQSVRKALLSPLVGLLIAEGKLSLDQTLEALGIDDHNPALTPEERQATLADILGSRSGIFHTALYEVGNWKDMRLALGEQERAAGRDLYPHGSYWTYNNWDFNAAGTIVTNASGMPIGEYFGKAIATRIGMEDFRPADVEYIDERHAGEQHFGNTSLHHAYVFNISTRDLARFALLHLGCGTWSGKDVVPDSWIETATHGIPTSRGRNAGQEVTGFGDYGYLWQIDRPGSRRYAGLKLKTPFYSASGGKGHAAFIFPALDLVVVHQVATVGGTSAEAQMRRAREGSPEVTDQQMEELLSAIIKAHPEGRDVFGDD